jgi:hypothetical protein
MRIKMLSSDIQRFLNKSTKISCGLVGAGYYCFSEIAKILFESACGGLSELGSAIYKYSMSAATGIYELYKGAKKYLSEFSEIASEKVAGAYATVAPIGSFVVNEISSAVEWQLDDICLNVEWLSSRFSNVKSTAEKHIDSLFTCVRNLNPVGANACTVQSYSSF